MLPNHEDLSSDPRTHEITLTHTTKIFFGGGRRARDETGFLRHSLPDLA